MKLKQEVLTQEGYEVRLGCSRVGLVSFLDLCGGVLRARVEYECSWEEVKEQAAEGARRSMDRQRPATLTTERMRGEKTGCI